MPSNSDFSDVGKVLVSSGAISEEDLRKRSSEFNDLKVGTLFGQYLVAKGAVTADQLEFALLKQEFELRGVNHSQVNRMIAISQRKNDESMRSVDTFISLTNLAVSKVNGG